MARDKILICAWLAMGFTVAGPALATAQGSISQDEARKRLESNRDRLEATQRRSKELQGDLDKIQA